LSVNKFVTKKSQTAKKTNEQKEIFEEPKRLSKAGEWRRAHPNSIEGMIVDMRAVMK